jgi:hypothetical protein
MAPILRMSTMMVIPIFVTACLQNKNKIKKKNLENWEKYQADLSAGYYHQFTRNVFQLNRGPVFERMRAGLSFSEISRLAGMEATDWSGAC